MPIRYPSYGDVAQRLRDFWAKPGDKSNYDVLFAAVAADLSPPGYFATYYNEEAAAASDRSLVGLLNDPDYEGGEIVLSDVKIWTDSATVTMYIAPCVASDWDSDGLMQIAVAEETGQFQGARRISAAAATATNGLSPTFNLANSVRIESSTAYMAIPGEFRLKKGNAWWIGTTVDNKYVRITGKVQFLEIL